MGAQRIGSLQTHTVQTYRLLEHLVIVFCSGVQFAHGLNHHTLRYTTAIVAYRHCMIIGYINLKTLAKAHLELIDTVIDDLLEKDIYTVVALRTIAKFTYIHTGTQTYMFHIAQVADGVIGIIGSNRYILIKFQIYIFGHLLLFLSFLNIRSCNIQKVY